MARPSRRPVGLLTGPQVLGGIDLESSTRRAARTEQRRRRGVCRARVGASPRRRRLAHGGKPLASAARSDDPALARLRRGRPPAISHRHVAADAPPAHPPLGGAHPLCRPPQTGGGEAADHRERHQRRKARDRSSVRPSQPVRRFASASAPMAASVPDTRMPPIRRVAPDAPFAALSSRATMNNGGTDKHSLRDLEPGRLSFIHLRSAERVVAEGPALGPPAESQLTWDQGPRRCAPAP